jgi:hypothetical protein
MLFLSRILVHRFAWLFASLAGIFFAYPLAVIATGGVTIVNAIEALIVLTAAVASSRSRRELILLAGLALLAIVMDWGNDYGWPRQALTSVAESALYAIFYLRVTTIILRQVFAPARVTANEILGACSAYLILAIVWAHIFHIVGVLAPGSFQGLAESGNEGALQSDLLYFSVTTLTTSGIGDIVPINRIARMLTALEAVVGQLYLVVLVAHFVGLHVAHWRGNHEENRPNRVV